MLTLEEVAKFINGTLIGERGHQITALSSLDNIIDNTLVFVENPDKLFQAETSSAAAIIVPDGIYSDKKSVIQVKKPLQAFIRLFDYFYPPKPYLPMIHPTAIIEKGVIIEEGVHIGPYVVVEENSYIGANSVILNHVSIGHEVKLGQNCLLYPKVTIYNRCIIGNEVIIHSGAVIGSDGFGYINTDGEHQKIPHIGNVIIEDKVEIGANTVLDRATIGHTTIGFGTKIDNLVQVAHSVTLGQHNILCAFTGIAGSTKTGNHVIFAANVGVSDHVKIEDNVILGARAGVPSNKHLKEATVYLGSPARPRKKAIEHELSVSRIPLMRKNIERLRERIKIIEAQLDK